MGESEDEPSAAPAAALAAPAKMGFSMGIKSKAKQLAGASGFDASAATDDMEEEEAAATAEDVNEVCML